MDHCGYVSDWSSLIVGKTSPWLQLDSDVDHVRKNSEKVRPLSREVRYMSVQYIEIFLAVKKEENFSIFSSPEPKAHRSAYSIPMLRRPSVRPLSVVCPSSVRRPQF